MNRTQIQTQRLILKGMVSELPQEKQDLVREMEARLKEAHAANMAASKDEALIASSMAYLDITLEGMNE